MNGQVQTYRTITENPGEAVQRCIELIRRRAPGMMRAGGGGLSASLGPYARVTVEQRERVLRLRTEGLSYDAIAAEVGLGFTTAQRICVKAGHATRKRPPRLPVEVWDQIRAHRLEGKQPREIARVLGISPAAVAMRLKVMGLSNPPGGPRKARVALPLPSVGGGS